MKCCTKHHLLFICLSSCCVSQKTVNALVWFWHVLISQILDKTTRIPRKPNKPFAAISHETICFSFLFFPIFDCHFVLDEPFLFVNSKHLVNLGNFMAWLEQYFKMVCLVPVMKLCATFTFFKKLLSSKSSIFDCSFSLISYIVNQEPG